LHGGFIIGLITLLTYAAAVAMQDLSNHRGFNRGSRLGAIAGAAAAATLLPPCGLNTWRAVLTTLCNPTTFKISEWQPLSAAIEAQWRYSPYGIGVYLCLLALWAGLVVSILWRPHGGDFPLVLIALVISLTAVRSMRNEPLAAIACVIPAARHLGLLFSGEMPQSSEAAVTLPLRAQWLIAGAALLLTSREILAPRLPTDMAYPSTAVKFMHERRLHGNLLTYFCWGEYLIWHLPDSKVFFDARYDMVYPPRVTEDYLTFYWVLPGADKVLRNYDHDFILIPADEKAYDTILRVGGWKLIYRDVQCVLFARAGAGAARLPSVPVIGSAPSVQYFP
jgi:hypothetical protein